MACKTLIEDNLGFPDSSVGKESTCNAGDPGSIPGLLSSLPLPMSSSQVSGSLALLIQALSLAPGNR